MEEYARLPVTKPARDGVSLSIIFLLLFSLSSIMFFQLLLLLLLYIS